MPEKGPFSDGWLRTFKAELDDLYRESQVNGISNGVALGTVQLNDDNLAQQVRLAVAESSEISQDQLSDDADFFELGLDSLQVTSIVKRLNKSLAASGAKQVIDTQTVYSTRQSLRSRLHFPVYFMESILIASKLMRIK